MRYLIHCFLLMTSLMPSAWALPEPQAQSSPPFLGTTLPDPPRQNAPWEPPNSDLPTALESAAKTLFDQGLADPRGCEYREISVGTGDVWSGDGGVVKVHGWVLPAIPGETQPFAVCWNGLVYSVVSVGDKADLAADAAILVKVKSPGGFERATAERFSLSEKSPAALKACLLLRLGETDLAKQVWGALETNPQEKDPYLRLASEWAWALFDRAVTAHMRGDDELSVLSARRLTMVQPLVEAEAARRGLERPRFYDSGPHLQPHPYLSFLDPLPRLLADEERRAADQTPRPALADMLAMPNKAARIAALIRALDQSAARQMSQPGSVSPDDDPIVQGLIAQGDDAVQPLIDTVGTDTRLTRSVGFARDFFQDRSLVSVAGTATAALIAILHTSTFGPPGTWQNRVEVAAALQAYWDKYRGLPLTERWYKTLADDKATSAQWLDAAHEIIRPSGEQVRGGWIERNLPSGVGVPPHGAALRRKHTPSVTALMARRIHALITYSGAPDNDSRQFNDAEDATAMALYLAAWDPQAARPTLRDQFETERKALDHWRTSMDVTYNSLSLTKLTLARMQSGDPAALADYVDWLKGTPLKNLPIFNLSDILEPLWRAPDDPAVTDGAAWLFTNPRSPWVPLIQERPNGLYGSSFEGLLESPLLGLTAFRQAALAALADRTVIQTVTLGGPGRQPDDEVLGNDREVDPYRPATPQAFPVRRCDLYAWHLSHLGGMPAFEYDWPTDKKEAAVAEAAARLRRYGALFAAELQPIFPGILPGEGGSPQTPSPLLRFPRLAHPATAEDVAQNRAIFALGVGAHVKPLPEWPLPARWVTNRRYPQMGNVWSAARRQYESGQRYSQDGNVWQAEETADGQRFFGFVGPHDIARVPASEIEFRWDNDYSWTSLTSPFDCEVVLADNASRRKVGAPLRITLKLRNRTGLDQILPTTLGPGITLKLSYAPPVVGTSSYLAENSRTWTDLLPRPKAAFSLVSAPKALTPTQEITALRLDLRDWFDLQRPGSYKLQFLFDGKRSGLGDGQSQPIMFDLGN